MSDPVTPNRPESQSARGAGNAMSANRANTPRKLDSNRSPSGDVAKVWRIAMSVGLVVSLAINGFLIYTLLRLRDGFAGTLAAARNSLVLSDLSSIELNVEVDQEIPIDTTVSINQRVSVPIDIEYPLNTVVTTFIDLPVIGRQEITIPVETTIPINTTLDIPIDLDLPISLVYPLKLSVPVQVQLPSSLVDSLEDVLYDLDQSMQVIP